MPLMEFECTKCNFLFEKIFQTRSDYIEGEVACPNCNLKEHVKRHFSGLTQTKFTLSKTKRLNLIDRGFKLSKQNTPPGLKRLNY